MARLVFPLMEHILRAVHPDWKAVARVVLKDFNVEAPPSGQYEQLLAAISNAVTALSGANRTAMLAVVAPLYTQQELSRVGIRVSKRAYSSARQHSKQYGPGYVPPPKSDKGCTDKPPMRRSPMSLLPLLITPHLERMAPLQSAPPLGWWRSLG